MAACRAEAARPRRLPRRTTVILLAAVLTAAATLTVGAIGSANEWFGLRGRNESHFADLPDADIIIAQPDALVTVASPTGAPLELRCNAVTGGGNQVFFDLTLTRTDGSPILTLAETQTLTHLHFPNATLTFGDGLCKSVSAYPLADSTPECFHIEGLALLYTTELGYIGQSATLNLGEAAMYVREQVDLGLRQETLDKILRGKNAALDIAGSCTVTDWRFAPGGEVVSALGRQADWLYLSIGGSAEQLDALAGLVPQIDGSDSDLLWNLRREDGQIALAVGLASHADADESLLSRLTLAVIAEKTLSLPDTAQPLAVSLTYRNETLDRDISPVTIVRDGVTITMTHIELTNAELVLSGSCDAPDGTKMPWLDTILGGAYLTLADGTTITCGGKNGCGNLPDGSLVLTWLLGETVGAAKVVSLTLDGQTVTFD